ncbi:MAG: hypothetical protein MJ240_06600 [Kiritimatiellae bacterium]|nr:hypothetical protein [Kiritimatiellia bacterium]
MMSAVRWIKSVAGNPRVRLDAGNVVSQKARHGSLLYTVRSFLVGAVAAAGLMASAAPSVTVGNVKTGEPWSTITVDYTLGGVDADLDYRVAFDVTANGVTKGVTNAATKLADGTASKVIDTAALFGSASADPKAKVRVSLIAVKPQPGPEPEPEPQLGGVQLWENGPYWAECNVGASKPEEDGYYFWWGDTVGYKREGGTRTDDYSYSGVTWVSSTGTRMGSSPFNYSTCPTCDKSNSTLQSQGYIDSTGNLEAKYDAATAHLGAPWRMPTDAEFSALISNCTTTWAMKNGVRGRLVTGMGAYASKSIFLPAAGCGRDSDFDSSGSGGGYYWSSSPNSDDSYNAWYLLFNSGSFCRSSNRRFSGFPVRPLRGFAK